MSGKIMNVSTHLLVQNVKQNTRGVFNTVWSAFKTSPFEWYNSFHVQVSSNTQCVQRLVLGCIHLQNRKDTHRLHYTTNLHLPLVNNSARMMSCGTIDTKSLPKIDYYKNLTHKHKNKLIARVTLPFYLSHLVEDTKPNIQTDYTDHLVDISRLCTIIQVCVTPTNRYKSTLLSWINHVTAPYLLRWPRPRCHSMQPNKIFLPSIGADYAALIIYTIKWDI